MRDADGFCSGCGHREPDPCWSGCPVNGDAAAMLRYFAPAPTPEPEPEPEREEPS